MPGWLYFIAITYVSNSSSGMLRKPFFFFLFQHPQFRKPVFLQASHRHMLRWMPLDSKRYTGQFSAFTERDQTATKNQAKFLGLISLLSSSFLIVFDFPWGYSQHMFFHFLQTYPELVGISFSKTIFHHASIPCYVSNLYR